MFLGFAFFAANACSFAVAALQLDLADVPVDGEDSATTEDLLR